MFLRSLCIIALILAFTACKKNYSCECRNSYSSYDAGEVKATKRQAEKYCKDLSTADTKCNVK